MKNKKLSIFGLSVIMLIIGGFIFNAINYNDSSFISYFLVLVFANYVAINFTYIIYICINNLLDK